MTHYRAIWLFLLWLGFGQVHTIAQNYIPMAQDSTIWFYEANPNAFAPIERFVFFTDGDTSVNSFLYKKLYFKAENQDNTKLIAGLRDNISSKKVYLQLFTTDLSIGLSIVPTCPLTVEILLYDFSALPSQYIANICNQSAYLTDTATQFLYKKNRRVLTLSHINQTWYEGIGSTKGLFNALLNSSDYNLANYCVGNFDACEVPLFLDTDFIPINKLGKIFPNPAAASFSLELTKELYHAEIVISNIFGQVAAVHPFDGITKKIDISGLANGVYFVEVFKDGMLFFKDKLMVAK